MIVNEKSWLWFQNLMLQFINGVIVVKPVRSHSNDKMTKDGLGANCKQCKHQEKKEYTQRKRESKNISFFL